MTHKVGPKGQVVIPRELREELGIEPGDEVTFWRDHDHVAVQPVRRSTTLKGRFGRRNLTGALEEARAADRAREARR
jgi:AbrB family looped-hinge helix DNA binding protein